MELRMLAGLHRGAALELGKEALALGASPEAEIMLADPGVASLHLRISCQGAVFVLVPEDGDVFDEQGQPLTDPIELTAGSRFRVGEAWIGFFETGEPWRTWMPPVHAVAPAVMSEDAAAGPETGSAGQDMARVNGRFLDIGRHWASLPPAWRRLAMLAVIGLLLMLIALVSMVHAFFAKGAPRRDDHLPPALPAVAASASASRSPLAAAAAAEASLPLAKPAAPSALADIFRRKLAERELTERIDLDLGERQWKIRASLDTDEQGRLQRLLKSFRQTYHPDFPIDLALVAPRDLLPFKIVEVTFGKNANVVTDSGRRLYVGDVADGYRLAEVNPSRLVFSGLHRIEVAW
jgi:type III secretion protein D